MRLRIVSCIAVFAIAVAGCSETGHPMTVDAPPASADTWPSYAAGFFVTYCNSCHNAQDTTGRDYSMQADVAKDMMVMRCGVAAVQDASWNCAASPAAKQFPIGSGPKPSDAERARIVAWITAGEP